MSWTTANSALLRLTAGAAEGLFIVRGAAFALPAEGSRNDQARRQSLL